MSENDPWKNWYQQPTPGDPASADRTVSMPQPSNRPTFGRPLGPAAATAVDTAGAVTAAAQWRRAAAVAAGARSRRWSPRPDRRHGAPGRSGSGGGRRWRFWGQPGRHGRRIALVIGVVILLFIVGIAGSYFWINGKLNRTVALPATTATSAGTNWLIAGSDQRTGISRAERAKLHLGAEGADASDSLMLLHMGTGKPVLISIPRDSYVPIPGHGTNKINAALAFGGPTLLVQTVESVTGLRIDHYMGIGFGGLADVVNAVGGVQMCVKTAIPADPTGDSGFKGIAAGCHNLSGTQAIAFVRDRHSFATSDLQRIQDQRAFLSALLSKATSPGVYLNPFTALPFASTAASAIAVDKGSSL